MRKDILALAALSFLFIESEVARADIVRVPGHSPPVSCGPKAKLLEPYISTPRAARDVFLAVEAARVPTADKAHFPLVDVLERGSHWLVVRHSAAMIGGGQLELEISKCTGQIFRASFAK